MDLTELHDLVEQIPAPEGDVDDLIDTWDLLKTIADTLAVHVRSYSTAAGLKLADLDYDRKTGFQSHGGVIVHHTQRATDAWDGTGVLSALSAQAIDPATGELVPAVTIDTLTDVLPAISGKSSRWKTSGLKVHGIDPDKYRTRSWAQPTIARGGQR